MLKTLSKMILRGFRDVGLGLLGLVLVVAAVLMLGWAIAAVGERRAGRGVPAPPTWVRAVHANVQ